MLAPPVAAAMDEFVDQTKTLIRALGCDLFRVFAGINGVQDGPRADVNTQLDEIDFKFKGTGYSATMRIAPSGEFVILKDSIARAEVTPTVPRNVPLLRDKLLESGVLARDTIGLRFLSSYTFPSVSSAAAFIYGGSSNGRVAWKLPDGRTYADWESEGAAAINIV